MCVIYTRFYGINCYLEHFTVDVVPCVQLDQYRLFYNICESTHDKEEDETRNFCIGKVLAVLVVRS